MENNNSRDYLKNLLNKILINNFTEQEIIDFINQVLNKNFSNDDYLIIIEIIYLLKFQSLNLIPLISLNLDYIIQKIIFNNIDNDVYQKDKENIIKKESKNENSVNWDINTPEGFIKFREYQKKKFSPFKKEKNPNLKYPEPGHQVNMYFIDNTSIPNKKFRSEVLIDSDGNITDFLNGPNEICDATNYNEIYKGLVGQLFDYQK